MQYTFKLPDIGEGIHDGEIVQWLIHAGDSVEEDQPLLEVMTDKVTAEIPSPVSGRVVSTMGNVGDVILVGKPVVIIETGASEAPMLETASEDNPLNPETQHAEVDSEQINSKPAPPAAVSDPKTLASPGTAIHEIKQSATEQPDLTVTMPKPAEDTLSQPSQVSQPKQSSQSNQPFSVATHSNGDPVILATPSTRRLARGLGVSLESVQGTGKNGRITPDDIYRTAEKSHKETAGTHPAENASSPSALSPSASSPSNDAMTARVNNEPRDSDPLSSDHAGLGGNDSENNTKRANNTKSDETDQLESEQSEQRPSSPSPSAESNQEAATALAHVPLPSALTVSGAQTSRVAYSGVRRKVGQHLLHAKQNIPHFAYADDVDMTGLLALREELLPAAEEKAIRLNFLPFIIKAVIEGLREFPSLNAMLDDSAQEIVYQHFYNIGIAVATDAGLIVPVVHNAHEKGILQLAAEISHLSRAARNNQLAVDQVRGGTFTITSIGSLGGVMSIPIINSPEAAILGVNKMGKRPVVRVVDGTDQIVIRQMMTLSISCDHRLVDGAEAAMFINHVTRYLEQPSLLLLAGEL
ncbi:MAG: dihydrolipoamide acetyltransferase family protein [Cyanobacteria bacterium P01_H01_bin.74]